MIGGSGLALPSLHFALLSCGARQCLVQLGWQGLSLFMRASLPSAPKVLPIRVSLLLQDHLGTVVVLNLHFRGHWQDGNMAAPQGRNSGECKKAQGFGGLPKSPTTHKHTLFDGISDHCLADSFHLRLLRQVFLALPRAAIGMCQRGPHLPVTFSKYYTDIKGVFGFSPTPGF